MKFSDYLHVCRYGRRLRALAVMGLLTLMGVANAANHALILWIGDYGRPDLDLPGIQTDASRAREIAQLLGVPSQQIREVANRDLTRQTLASELEALWRRIGEGDRLFVYYSGHGHQISGVAGARCTEALVLQGPDLYPDFELQDALVRLGRKASQVVVMNDSCFSGGAATKSLRSARVGSAVPKFFPVSVGGTSAVTGSYQCGTAVNKMSRSLEVVAAPERGPQVLYLAAASDTEVAWASPNGSVATLAWRHCIAEATTDTDRSGAINGQELQACAQRYIDTRTEFRQTLTIQGNPLLPLAQVVAADTGASTSIASSTHPSPTETVDAAQALIDLREAASRDYRVRLDAAASNLRIRNDFLDFSVTTDRPGYLYVLQVGSDGRTFNLVFPNRLDNNHYVQAGTHRLPRDHWRVRAGGPVGTSYLMAVIAPVPKDFTRGMDASAAFATAPATRSATRTLFVEATGASGGGGSYGASNIVAIQETP
jgi:hypothetical protein